MNQTALKNIYLKKFINFKKIERIVKNRFKIINKKRK